MNNTAAIALVMVGVIVVTSTVIRLAAVTFDPRWRRRAWCVYSLGIGGAILGGVWAGIADGHPEGVLVASVMCAVLGSMGGNVVRILSGPSSPRSQALPGNAPGEALPR